MTVFGLKFMAELRGAQQRLNHARAAQDDGFEYVAISDQFHP